MSTRPLDEVPARARRSAARDERRRSVKQLAAAVETCLPPGTPVLAFSGGADSTALLYALLQIKELSHLVVAHVDHGLDPASQERARAAEQIARAATQAAGRRFFACPPMRADTAPQPPDRSCARRSTGVHFVHRSVRVTSADRKRHGGVEAAARALRYRSLERLCLEGADPKDGVPSPAFLVTAHHLDDQLETLVLRLRQGTGLIGLAGIRLEGRTPAGIRVHRPLLAIDHPPGGADLRHLLRVAGVSWTEDPGNSDLSVHRNRVRRRILPALLETETEPTQVREVALRLANASQGFAAWRNRWARTQLDLRVTESGVDLAFGHWSKVPRPLRDQALGAMHRAAGLRSDPPAAARDELHRQLAASAARPHERSDVPAHAATEAKSASSKTPATFRQPSEVPARCTGMALFRVACAAGSGWQWTVRPGDSPGSGARLQLRPEPRRSDASTLGNAPDFTYTPRIPGVTAMPEIGCSLQVTREPYDGWMSRAWPDRAACYLPDPRATVTVRNRIIGDTLHPFGSPSKRVKLKKLLIDRKIPRDQRSTLPLVCIGGEIAWVPGVAIGDSFRIPARLTGETPADRENQGERHERSGRHRSSGPRRPSDLECPSNDLVWVFRLLPTDSAPHPLRDQREPF